MEVTGKTDRYKDRLLFAVYIAGYLIAAVFLAFAQPDAGGELQVFGPPDESSRYLIPQFICEHGYLPTGFEDAVRVEGYNISYAFHPILPYIIMGYLMRILRAAGLPAGELLYAARSVNVLSGLAFAVILYLLAGRLFQKSPFRWLFCFGVLYLPQQLFVHTYVNTDSMCMLSIAMMIYALVRMYEDGPDRLNAALLAIGVTVLLQTYYNAYGYVVSAALLYVLYFVRREKDGTRRLYLRECMTHAWPVLLFVMVFAGWWFVREAILLDGDITGIATNARLRRTPVMPPAEEGIGLIELFRTRPVLQLMTESFIARYGSMSIIASPQYYFFYELYLAAGLLLSVPRPGGVRTAGMRRKQFAACMALAVLLNVILWVYYLYWNDYQPQGRYLLPSLIPLYYAVARGYESLAKRFGQKRIEQAAAGMLTAFVVIALYHYVFKLCYPVYCLLQTS
ncbi:MAG: glycosyltransferase family 39 protein [Butyrivibrio sp.]|nr:glycosyltransferase family 39 protein [Butyrivibrio sp.]